MFSVAPAGRRLFIASTNIDTPKVSNNKMNSWRSPEHVCPVRVKNPMAYSHSSCIRSTSFAKSCRCRVRRGFVSLPILGFAAVFQSLRSTVAPADGSAQLICAFEAVIIGGMGSVWGAFAGAMILGIAQAIGFRIDPGLGVLAGHIVFLLILVIRPQGLFGKA